MVMSADLESLVLRDVERNGPTTLADIAWRVGISRRAAEEAVQELRLAGHPIVAGTAGLSIARTADELRAWLDSNDGRIRAMLRTRAAMRRALRPLALVTQSYNPEAGFWGDVA